MDAQVLKKLRSLSSQFGPHHQKKQSLSLVARAKGDQTLSIVETEVAVTWKRRGGFLCLGGHCLAAKEGWGKKAVILKPFFFFGFGL